MIRITSIGQALSLKGTIPELAIARAKQFMCDGYDPEEHGHIIVLMEGEAFSEIPEIGTDSLLDSEGLPTYDIIEAYEEGDQVLYEIVFQIDDSRTIAIIAPAVTFNDTPLALTASALKGARHEDLTE